MRSFIPASTLILTMLLLVGCGSVQSIRLPETDDMLVTSEDIDLPYEPIGMINPYRVGFYLFGVVDINSPASDELLIDLLNKQLIAEARKLGGRRDNHRQIFPGSSELLQLVHRIEGHRNSYKVQIVLLRSRYSFRMRLQPRNRPKIQRTSIRKDSRTG